jgi:hypothetical protein
VYGNFNICSHRIVFWQKKSGNYCWTKKKVWLVQVLSFADPFRPFCAKLGYFEIHLLHTVSIFAHRIVFWQKNRETTAGQKKSVVQVLSFADPCPTRPYLVVLHMYYTTDSLIYLHIESVGSQCIIWKKKYCFYTYFWIYHF